MIWYKNIINFLDLASLYFIWVLWPLTFHRSPNSTQNLRLLLRASNTRTSTFSTRNLSITWITIPRANSCSQSPNWRHLYARTSSRKGSALTGTSASSRMALNSWRSTTRQTHVTRQKRVMLLWKRGTANSVTDAISDTRNLLLISNRLKCKTDSLGNFSMKSILIFKLKKGKIVKYSHRSRIEVFNIT